MEQQLEEPNGQEGGIEQQPEESNRQRKRRREEGGAEEEERRKRRKEEKRQRQEERRRRENELRRTVELKDQELKASRANTVTLVKEIKEELIEKHEEDMREVHRSAEEFMDSHNKETAKQQQMTAHWQARAYALQAEQTKPSGKGTRRERTKVDILQAEVTRLTEMQIQICENKRLEQEQEREEKKKEQKKYDSMKKYCDDATTRLREQGVKISKQQQQIDTIITIVRSLEQANEEYKQRNASLEGELGLVKTMKEYLEKKVRDMKLANKGAQTKLEQLVNTTDGTVVTAEMADKLKKELDSKAMEVANLNVDITERDETISDLSKDVSSLAKKLGDKDREVKELQEEVAGLSAKLEEKDDLINDLNQELNDARDQLTQAPHDGSHTTECIPDHTDNDVEEQNSSTDTTFSKERQLDEAVHTAEEEVENRDIDTMISEEDQLDETDHDSEMDADNVSVKEEPAGETVLVQINLSNDHDEMEQGQGTDRANLLDEEGDAHIEPTVEEGPLEEVNVKQEPEDVYNDTPVGMSDHSTNNDPLKQEPESVYDMPLTKLLDELKNSNTPTHVAARPTKRASVIVMSIQ